MTGSELTDRAFRVPPPHARWLQLDVGLARAGGDALPSARAMFAALVPLLDGWQDERRLHGWFFMRKPPDVRLRLRLLPEHAEDSQRAVERTLAPLLATGRVRLLRRARYVPETARFGGPGAMALAHAHFHVDSRLWWTVSERTPGTAAPHDPDALPCALAHHLLLCCCGREGVAAAWARLAALTADGRCASAPTPPLAPPSLDAQRARPDLDPAHRAALDAWRRGNEKLGEALADLAARGGVSRPLADVAAAIALFDFNRHGLPGTRSGPLSAGVLSGLRAPR